MDIFKTKSKTNVFIKLSFLITFLLLIQSNINAQNRTKIISGTVTASNTNQTIVGATVIIPNTNIATITDSNGKYTINVPEVTKTIQVSYIGYIPKTIEIKNLTKIDIQLDIDLLDLDEVVVVGYGTQKKKDLTGSVSVVDMDEVAKKSVSTIDQALQGQIAGVSVTSNSGTPGGGVMVRIRGIGTINDSEPLYVVDGMMVDDVDFLNTNDVESIQVLKDASATAIYGSRGSNGVVIITTKKGKKGGQVTFNSYYGVQNFWRSTNVLDAQTWGTLKNEAMVAAGNTAPITDPSALKNTNWFNEISNKNAVINSNDISFSGANKKGNYFFSANTFKQEGIVKKTSFDRISFRANSSYNVKSWLKIGENITLAKDKYKNVAEQDEWTSIIITSISKDPASQVKYDDGTYAAGIYNDTWNPAAILEYTNNNDVVYRTIGNIFADLKIAKNLNFKTSYSLEYSFGETDEYKPVYYVSSVQQNSISNLFKNNSNRLTKQWSNTLNYKKSYGEHTLSALIGAETYSFEYKYNGISVNNVPSDNPDIRYIDNATGNNAATVWGSISQTKMLSYLARINYNYLNKYLLTANFRADASSKFPKKNIWGYFPSFSAGWVISQEGFMQDFKNVSNLKLRAGWGQIGNQGSVPPYSAVTTASSGANYIWGGNLVSGSSFPSVGNPELKWETSTTTNFGIDYGFFKGKLSGTIEYFIKNTTDMLMSKPVPAQTGIESPPVQNVGDMKNSGIEFSTVYTNYDKKLKYSFGLNFSKIKNEVISLGVEDAFIDGAPFMNSYNVTRTVAGRPIAQFYGYKTDGIFQNQAEIDAQSAQTNVAPGDVRYVDADNDGELDFFFLGSPLPEYTFALNANLMYEGFDFNLALQGVQGNKIFNGTSFYKRSSTATWNLGSDMTNRWTGEGTQNDARYPRMNAADVNNSLMSDRFIEDGSFLRIKTLQLGYSLSSSILKKTHLQKLRIYINAQNLYTLTKYSGLDPEIGTNNYNPLDIGVDRGFYPQARVYSLGINLTF